MHSIEEVDSLHRLDPEALFGLQWESNGMHCDRLRGITTYHRPRVGPSFRRRTQYIQCSLRQSRIQKRYPFRYEGNCSQDDVLHIPDICKSEKEQPAVQIHARIKEREK